MTSTESQILVARIERFPIAGSFTISRGAKTEAVTVVAEISHAGLLGRGECVPYPRYSETPEATLAAILAMRDAIAAGLDRQALHAARRRPQCGGLRPCRPRGQARGTARLGGAGPAGAQALHHSLHHLSGIAPSHGCGYGQGRTPAPAQDQARRRW